MRKSALSHVDVHSLLQSRLCKTHIEITMDDVARHPYGLCDLSSGRIRATLHSPYPSPITPLYVKVGT
jgi:hypothetical protein